MNRRPWLLAAILANFTCLASVVSLTGVVASAQLPAQSSKTTRPAATSKPQAKGVAANAKLLTYPRDKDRVMATVDGRTVRLGEIIDHIDSHHFKGYKAYVSTSVGQLEIRRSAMADWVRQYADLLALRADARAREISETLIRAEMGAVFEKAFGVYVKQYEKRMNRAFPTSKGSVRSIRRRFQKEHGIAMEVEGLLNSLVSNKLDRAGINTFYKDHHESMTGYLTISQVFIANRDRKTGALLQGDALRAAERKTREISRHLDEGKMEFEDIAAKFSEDRKSAAKGGVLVNLQRFDPRMPASICEAAWGLRNGKWRGPITSRFGIHFVKRVKWTIVSMIVRPDPKNPQVIEFVWKHRKELHIFKTREERHVVLKY